MEKLSFLGIGPKIAILLLPWVVASIIAGRLYPGFFNYTSGVHNILFAIGIIMIILGLALYFSAVRLLLKGLKETRLVTKGPYSMCQNPLYSSIIVFIIPGLSFMLNSWLILTSSIVGYVLFKINIKKEYNELEKYFGESYVKYRNETPEFFPLPFL